MFIQLTTYERNQMMTGHIQTERVINTDYLVTVVKNPDYDLNLRSGGKSYKFFECEYAYLKLAGSKTVYTITKEEYDNLINNLIK